MSIPHDRRRPLRPAHCGLRRAFTLIELLTVFVILSILAGLTLSGLAGARQRAKIDKTRSTIRKIHEIVIPLYESYVESRYSPSAIDGDDKKKIAQRQLLWRRMRVTLDMPDQWSDVAIPGFVSPNTTLGYVPSAATRRYAKQPGTLPYESAECLYNIVVRGGFAPDSLEQFRADEIGDFDGDLSPEFHDGWGRPISFIRWPAGFPSVLSGLSDQAPRDPMDPLGVTTDSSNAYDVALMPLIYSGGANNSLDEPTPTGGDYGLVTSRNARPSGWLDGVNPAGVGAPSHVPVFFDALSSALGTTRKTVAPPLAGAVNLADPQADRARRDNITNHDFITK